MPQLRKNPFSEEEVLNKDKGAHYRNEYLGVPFDVYRAIRLFKITDPEAQHMFKKLARGTRKGHTEQDLVDELQCCLDRWKEILKEDSSPERLHND